MTVRMNPQSSPLVSIVVPVYNEAAYLAECLESVLAQTYTHWDCVVINNCSTDASLEIARKYASGDSRIRVHDNTNFLRAVANYNFGLRQICPGSKYCKILFADDWIFPEFLERTVAVAEAHPSIGIVGAYGLQGWRIMWSGLSFPSTQISGRTICRRLFLEHLYVFGTATSLLYRSDLVRNRDPFYNESNLHSDSETCLSLLKSCDFGFVHQVLTYTRVRPSSLSTFSAEAGTPIAGRLYDLVHYGRDFLTEEEYLLCVNRRLSEYYTFLARNLLRHRGKAFWKYHKQKLADVGQALDRPRLVRALSAQLVAAALCPRDTIDWFFRRRKLRKENEYLKHFQENQEAC
jgi:glycosyltransferase involved in cell wall biosynthesis